jgi:hypothetical protein
MNLNAILDAIFETDLFHQFMRRQSRTTGRSSAPRTIVAESLRNQVRLPIATPGRCHRHHRDLSRISRTPENHAKRSFGTRRRYPPDDVHATKMRDLGFMYKRNL